jgi:hypothetical protein
MLALRWQATQTHCTNDLATMVNIYGGKPVGSFMPIPGNPVQLCDRTPRALFLDCTHDNETPSERV